MGADITFRIGLWGSSFSGGLVVYAAEHDAREALHSQAPALDGRWVMASEQERKTYDELTRRARCASRFRSGLGARRQARPEAGSPSRPVALQPSVHNFHTRDANGRLPG